MRRVLALLVLLPLNLGAQEAEREIQRQLILRDQQSAEFARQVREGSASSPALDALHQQQLRDAGRPLHPDAEIDRQLRPYQRESMARERQGHVLQLPPPVISRRPMDAPRPLPGLPGRTVEPVAAPVGG